MDYFLVSTPLQYCNAYNIHTDEPKTLVFLGDFHGAELFYKRLCSNIHWEHRIWFVSYRKLFSYLRKRLNNNDRLFIDSDYGLQTNFMLSRLKTKEIYVYEEGTGSYRNDLLSARCSNKVFYNLLSLLGNKEHFGGSKWVKGIYLYDHKKHISNVPDFKGSRLSFRKGFVDNLKEVYSEILSEQEKVEYKNLVKGKSVCMYITNWKYNPLIDDLFRNLKETSENEDILFVLKPHPRLEEFSKNFEFDTVLSNSVMVEYILLIFKEFAANLVVYHEGSSALLYLDGINNKTLDAI